jgi:uncharacterized protein YraI
MGRARTLIVSAALLLVFAATAVAQSVAFTNGPANLRAGPERDYPLIASVPPGTQLQIYGCTDDYTWCDVTSGQDRGWIYARHLDYDYQGRHVLIYGRGPSLGLPIVTFSVGSYWDTYYRGRPWYGRRSYWAGRPVPVRRPVVVHRPGPRPGPPAHVARPQGGRPSTGRPPSGGAVHRAGPPPRTPQHTQPSRGQGQHREPQRKPDHDHH